MGLILNTSVESQTFMTRGATDTGNLFYSYALAEFWVRAFGCDWLTPDTRPWCRSTASCRRIRCYSPRDASHSSSPSSDAAARGSSQDACWSRLVTTWSVVKHVPCKKRVVQYITDFLLICMQYTTHAAHGFKRITWLSWISSLSVDRDLNFCCLEWFVAAQSAYLPRYIFWKSSFFVYFAHLSDVKTNLLSEMRYSFHYSSYLWNSCSSVICDGSINSFA